MNKLTNKHNIHTYMRIKDKLVLFILFKHIVSLIYSLFSMPFCSCFFFLLLKHNSVVFYFCSEASRKSARSNESTNRVAKRWRDHHFNCRYSPATKHCTTNSMFLGEPMVTEVQTLVSPSCNICLLRFFFQFWSRKTKSLVNVVVVDILHLHSVGTKWPN